MNTLAEINWASVNHAYGPASDIPEVFGIISKDPLEGHDLPEWQYLWGALCHQGDVYDASALIMPFFYKFVEKYGVEKVVPCFFGLPAAIEESRRQRPYQISIELIDQSYIDLMRNFAKLLYSAKPRKGDRNFNDYLMHSQKGFSLYRPLPSQSDDFGPLFG